MSNPKPPFEDTDLDDLFIGLLRRHVGQEWDSAKAKILAALPEDVDPSLLAKYVDDSARPTIDKNEYGVEPRFYAHRQSRRLLEFYPSK
jgi:hypothetical protein